MDLLQRGINADRDIRIVTAVTTGIAQEACERHRLRAGEAIILGRALTAGCLLATLTKEDAERVRIQVAGEGPLGRVFVDARGNGTVRGCFAHRPDQDPEDVRDVDGRASVGHLVGRVGRMVVTRDLGLEHEYQGVVAVHSGEIDTDLERYLDESEQLPSVLACEVILGGHGNVLRAAGVLCQTFPDVHGDVLTNIRHTLRNGAFAELLRQERTPEELMGFALSGASFNAMMAMPLAFHCECGRDRALGVVSTLGADDIELLAAEQEHTEVKCTYCGRAFILGRSDLLELAATLRRHRS